MRRSVGCRVEASDVRRQPLVHRTPRLERHQDLVGCDRCTAEDLVAHCRGRFFDDSESPGKEAVPGEPGGGGRTPRGGAVLRALLFRALEGAVGGGLRPSASASCCWGSSSLSAYSSFRAAVVEPRLLDELTRAGARCQDRARRDRARRHESGPAAERVDGCRGRRHRRGCRMGSRDAPRSCGRRDASHGPVNGRGDDVRARGGRHGRECRASAARQSRGCIGGAAAGLGHDCPIPSDLVYGGGADGGQQKWQEKKRRVREFLGVTRKR